MVVELGKLLDVADLEIGLVDVVLVNGNGSMPLEKEDVSFLDRVDNGVRKGGGAGTACGGPDATTTVSRCRSLPRVSPLPGTYGTVTYGIVSYAVRTAAVP